MKIIFMGTPEFALAPLKRIYSEGHEIIAVFTQPDRAQNRGMKVSFSPVKEVALTHGISVYQPSSLKNKSIHDTIAKLDADIIVVVAYGKLLPKNILEIPPYGCINIHASLLPKYRGAAPIHWAIMNGEIKTGVTSMMMSEELDAGDIIAYKETNIGIDETTEMLHDRLSILGADLLSETLSDFVAGNIKSIPQDHSAASFAPPLLKDFTPIDWTDTPQNIKNKVRGLNSWPVATTALAGVVHKIYSVEIGKTSEITGKKGSIIATGPEGIEILCSKGTIIIKELQAPGSRRMTAAEYLRGKRLDIDGEETK
ncbi:MAG: methionyl-tRNA formyltransferase [Oscillospiraceae bacterium]|nr:methionyl-tRNA formyltransferase [Oscillospiraceae bacterium]